MRLRAAVTMRVGRTARALLKLFRATEIGPITANQG